MVSARCGSRCNIPPSRWLLLPFPPAGQVPWHALETLTHTLLWQPWIGAQRDSRKVSPLRLVQKHQGVHGCRRHFARVIASGEYSSPCQPVQQGSCQKCQCQPFPRRMSAQVLRRARNMREVGLAAMWLWRPDTAVGKCSLPEQRVLYGAGRALLHKADVITSRNKRSQQHKPNVQNSPWPSSPRCARRIPKETFLPHGLLLTSFSYSPGEGSGITSGHRQRNSRVSLAVPLPDRCESGRPCTAQNYETVRQLFFSV